MKKNLILVFFLFSTLLMSCKDEPKEEALPDNPTDEEVMEVCNLSEIISPYEQVNFTYNSNELVSSLKFDSYDFDCFFDESTEEIVCDTFLIKQELLFTYIDSLITSVTVLEDGAASEVSLELTYNDEDRISIFSFTYVYGDETDVDEYRLVYNTSGQVTKVENYEKYSGSEEFKLYAYESFKYEGDNVVEVNYFYESGFSTENKFTMKLMPTKFNNKVTNKTIRNTSSLNKADLESTALITYDDKLNPFYGNIPFLLYSNGFNFFLSKNNQLNYKETYFGTDPHSYSLEYSYEYNDSGLPILMRFTAQEDGETLTQEITLNYSCQ